MQALLDFHQAFGNKSMYKVFEHMQSPILESPHVIARKPYRKVNDAGTCPHGSNAGQM